MESLLGEEISDAELNAFAEQLQKPVTYEDPQFGTFTLNRSVNWYEASVMWNGQSIQLTLSVDAIRQL